jgi:hypothetical protein
MTWRTFTGGEENLYLNLLMYRAKKDHVKIERDELNNYFKLHLHRGISYLNAAQTESIEKFLSQKFPENKDAFLSKFNPVGAQEKPTEELKDISNTSLTGYSIPQQSPVEKQQNKQFKIGQGK